MSAEYFREVKKIIEEKTGVDPSDILMDSCFEDDLNVGEMEIIEILSELEEKYDITLMENRENLETVQDLVELLSEKIE